MAGGPAKNGRGGAAETTNDPAAVQQTPATNGRGSSRDIYIPLSPGENVFDRLTAEHPPSSEAARRWLEKIAEARRTPSSARKGRGGFGGGVLWMHADADMCAPDYGSELWRLFCQWGERHFIGGIDGMCKQDRFGSGFGNAAASYLATCVENWRPKKTVTKVAASDRTAAAQQFDAADGVSEREF